MSVPLPKAGANSNLFWTAVSFIVGPAMAYTTFKETPESLRAENGARESVDIFIAAMKNSLGDWGAATVIVLIFWALAGFFFLRYKL